MPIALSDIQIRDPFLLTESSGYYLYGTTDKNAWTGPGTGFDCYRSTDLETWTGPIAAFRPPQDFWSPSQYWAPEVHRHDGRYYMFATFTGPDGYRGTQILAADHPEGPFEPWSDGPVTPRKWQCLDGTFFLDEHGQPWIVYCHEWLQIHDGAVIAQRLSADLRTATGTPVFLFNASDAAWSRPLSGKHVKNLTFPAYVTDGPSLLRLDNGRLAMLWSSFGESGYAMGLAFSDSGEITGPWQQQSEPLWTANGGHGMFARLLDDRLVLVFHQPNDTPLERATIRPLAESGTTVSLLD